MKNLIILITLSLIMGSCLENSNSDVKLNGQIIDQQKLEVYTFFPERTYEDLRDCYNQFVKNDIPFFNEKYGTQMEKRIVYISGDEQSQVVPLFKDGIVENILWISENYYLLMNKQEELNVDRTPKRGYSKLFLITEDEFNLGNLSLLNDDYEIENTSTSITLAENVSTTTPGEIYGLLMPNRGPCAQWENEWLEVYYNFLGISLPIGGDLPPDAIPFSVMEEIIVEATNGECVCPSICRVIEALNNNNNVWQSAKDKVNQNYVSYELGLDLTFPVEDIEAALIVDLKNFLCNPNSITNPCTGDAIAADVLAGALLNSNPYLSEEGFYKELNKEDYIIEDDEFINCPYAQCIYDKIINSNSPINCKLVEPLFDDNDFGVILHISGSGTSGATTFDNTTNIANITLNISCDGNNQNDLSVVSDIIHEFIHAEIMMTLFNMGLDPNNLESFDEAWDNYQIDYMLNLKNTYDINDLSHAVMVFVEGDDNVPGGGAIRRIAEILWEINGKQLTIEHYYHLAWEGLRYIDSQWAEDKFGINSSYFNLHQELLITTPNLDIGC